LPGTRVLTSDDNARQNLWIEASALERALETMLGAQLREPLDFEPDVDWSRGLAASLKGQIDFLMRELARSDGVADNPVAFALTDGPDAIPGAEGPAAQLLRAARQRALERGPGLCSPRRGIYAGECGWTDPHGTCGARRRLQHPDAERGLSAIP